MAIDAGYKRIHNESEMQRAKFYSLCKRGKGPGVKNYACPGGWGFELLLDHKGWGFAVVWPWAVRGVATPEVLVGFV